MTAKCKLVGIGDEDAYIKIYIANTPNFMFKHQSDGIYPLTKNEIYQCGQACGNGWRKVFNVYAKFIYALSLPQLNTQRFSSWQDYRDNALLQANSATALLYSPPAIVANSDAHTNIDRRTNGDIHIVMGKTYGKSLSLPTSVTWVNHEFAINDQMRLIICPYFDYRQLSNIKILQLIDLVNEIHLHKTM